jgi:hypothetical protein
MAALAVTAALVELDVITTIGSGDALAAEIEAEITATTVIGAIVEPGVVVETVLLLCAAVYVEVEVTVTTTAVPVTVTVDTIGEGAVVASVEYHSGMNVSFMDLIRLNLPSETVV